MSQRKRLEGRAQRIHAIFLPPYSPELDPTEMLWRRIKYEWLPLSAYQSFQPFCSHVHRVLSGYGEKYRINFCRHLKLHKLSFAHKIMLTKSG
ncbi:transposase [Azotobacter chroococcum]|uniref:transposase n=1 Tax=Azotobacter chroococcum TaxID=353 RepID=UPI0013F16405